MQKIILDTNVLVSALISNSTPTRILYDLVLGRNVQLCLSEAIYLEYMEVLSRDKFRNFAQFRFNSEIVLFKLRELAILYQPLISVELLKDASDNKFLELAQVSSADYLITGNTKDFNLRAFEYTRIVSPREYWDSFASLAG